MAMMRPKGHHCPRDLELAADLELADDLRTSTISPIHLRRLRLPWHTELDALCRTSSDWKILERDGPTV